MDRKISLRRRILRAAGWLLGLFATALALAAVVVAVYLALFNDSARLRGWLETEAELLLGRDVTIEHFSVDLLNRAFALRGLRVAAAEGPPLLAVDELDADLTLGSVLRLRPEIGQLRIRGLRVRAVARPDGRVDVAGLGPPERAFPRASIGFVARALRIEDGGFVYENGRVPWRLEAEGLAVELERDPLGLRYEGTASYRAGRLRIGEGATVEGGLDARVVIDGERIVFERLALEGPAYALEGEGAVRFVPRLGLRLRLAGRVDPEAVVEGGPARLETGPARVDAAVELDDEGLRVDAGVAVGTARIAGVPVSDLEARVVAGAGGWRVETTRLRIAGGAAAVRAVRPAGAERVDVLLSFHDVRLERLAPAVPGDVSPLVSRIAGSVRVAAPLDSPSRWSGRFELHGVPPPGPPPDGARVVVFDAAGRFDEGDVHLDESVFRTERLTARLSGVYPLRGEAAIDLALEARELAEADALQRLVRTLLHPARPAVALGLRGAGGTRGRLRGRLNDLAYEGELWAEGLELRGTRWGTVRARGRLDRRALVLDRFSARRDGAVLEASGRVLLETAPPDYRVRFELVDWPLTDALRWTPLPVAVDGLVSGEGSLERAAGLVRGQTRLEVARGTLHGIAFEQAEMRVAFRGPRIDIASLSLARRAARIEGRLALDLEEGSIDGRLAGEAMPLADLLPASVGADWGGRLTAELRVAGSLPRPEVALRADGEDLRWREHVLGALDATARVEEGVLVATLALDGAAGTSEAELRAVLDAPGRPAEARVRWRRVDLARWARAFGAELPETVRVTGHGDARLAGSIDRPADASGRLVVDELAVRLADYELTGAGPLVVRLAEGRARVEPFGLVGRGGRVDVGGGVDLRGGRLELEANGAVDLAVLSALHPSLVGSGRASLAARLGGAWRAPTVDGELAIEGASLRVRGFPQTLADLRGRVRFGPRTLRTEGLRGHFGGAPVTLDATVLLDGLRADSFEARVAGRGLRVRYPEDLVATIDLDLALTGTRRAQLLSGRIDVHEAVWSREYDLAAGLLVAREEPFGVVEDVYGEAPLPGLRLDVAIVAPDALYVRNSIARIEARADLTLRGTFARPALVGRAEAIEGEVFFMGQRYDIVAGRVDFVDPTTIRPFFDLTAETRVRSYRVELHLTGTPEQFYPELTSDPPLTTVDILRLLAGASEQELGLGPLGTEEEEVATVGVASLLTGRLNQEVGRRAGRLFGLDRFSIDPFLVGQFANPTARVSVGKQVARDLSIRYSTNLNSTTESIVLIEYTPEGPVSWIISRDETGAFGIDVKFRKSF